MNYLVLSVGILRGKKHFWGGLKCWSLGEGWRTFCDPQADIVGLQMENHVNCFQELDLGKYNIAKFQVIIASVLFFSFSSTLSLPAFQLHFSSSPTVQTQ